MKKHSRLLLLLGGALLFNFLFWQEELALNALVFDCFLLPALFLLYPQAREKKIVRVLLLAHLLSAALLIVRHTVLSEIAYCCILLLLFAFSEYGHRSAWYAGGSLMLNGLYLPANLLALLKRESGGRAQKRPALRWLRFAIVPLLVLLIFFILYQLGNNVFARLVLMVSENLQWFFNHFFSFFSWSRFFFCCLGLLITTFLLLRATSHYFEKLEAFRQDRLQRIRANRMEVRNSFIYELAVGLMGKLARGSLALKNEQTVGIISLALVNLLLLLINLIDINYLWFHFTYTPDLNLTTLIHEGTETLILSIVLAMVLVLAFFRGNLNFYSRNKWLKWGAYAWILQNAILAVSVLVRDYYYIQLMGLAYKRIGVLAFLLLVWVGLATVLIKIRWKKTNYFLFRVNAWAVVVLLLLGSVVHWDSLIARYNLQHSDRIPLDIPFLYSLSDEALPVLDSNLALLQQKEKESGRAEPYFKQSGGQAGLLAERKKQFMQRQQSYSWLSWNFTDQGLENYFLIPKSPTLKN